MANDDWKPSGGFDRLWKALAADGTVDAFGGAQYRRARADYDRTRDYMVPARAWLLGWIAKDDCGPAPG
jgi:hypothetical protein